MRTVICFLICAVCSAGFAQTRYASLDEALATSALLTGKSGPSSVNWIEGGKRFSYKGQGDVIRLYDPATQKEEVLFDPANHTFPGTQTPFDYESFEWSNDFKFLVFRTNVRIVWRHSGYADYYLYSVTDKSLKLIARDAYTAQLSPDGKKVGYERNGNLFVMELATQNEKQLTDDAKEFFYNGRFGWAYEEEWGLVQGWGWSHDSQYMAYWQSDEREVPVYQYTNYTGFTENYKYIPYPRVGDKNPAVRIGVLNINTGKNQWVNVDCGEGYIPRIYWTSDPKQLAVVHVNRKQNHMQMYFANIDSGEATKIFEEKSDTWISVFSFGANIMHFLSFPKNAREFFWISERNGWSHIYRYDYTGKLINQVTNGNWEMVKTVYADHQKKMVYYVSAEESPLERHLYVIGYDGKNKKRLTSAPGNHSIDFGGQYYIDTYSNVNMPKQVELYNRSGKLIKKLEANENTSAFIKSHTYSPKELAKFTTSDGQSLDISIIKPVNFDPQKKYPLLLDVYGGPEHQSVYNSFASDGWHQYLSQQGYVVVQVNNRGGASYGRAFKKVVYEKLGHWECNDFAETARYMSTMPWIDASNIAIKGHSYGGFTAAYSILNYPEVYKAAIIAAPVSDWRIYDAIYTERFMGLLPENKNAYDKSSVLTYVKNLQDKILIVHSTFDDNVHVRNTMQLVDALIDNGKDAELRIYQRGGHGIAYNKPSYQLLFRQYTEFLERNLKR